MRHGYKELPQMPHLYPSQTLFNMWTEAESDDELETVYNHLLNHDAFYSPEYPDYLDLSELFLDEEAVHHLYNETGVQNRIDSYLDFCKNFHVKG